MTKITVLALALACLLCWMPGKAMATEPTEVTEVTEAVDAVIDSTIERPFLITPFDEYTVTEGLLLLIFLVLLLFFVLELIRRF